MRFPHILQGLKLNFAFFALTVAEHIFFLAIGSPLRTQTKYALMQTSDSANDMPMPMQ